MRQGFYECSVHSSVNRSLAFKFMPFAFIVVDVVGGYLGFESVDDYTTWLNENF